MGAPSPRPGSCLPAQPSACLPRPCPLQCLLTGACFLEGKWDLKAPLRVTHFFAITMQGWSLAKLGCRSLAVGISLSLLLVTIYLVSWWGRGRTWWVPAVSLPGLPSWHPEGSGGVLGVGVPCLRWEVGLGGTPGLLATTEACAVPVFPPLAWVRQRLLGVCPAVTQALSSPGPFLLTPG